MKFDKQARNRSLTRTSVQDKEKSSSAKNLVETARRATTSYLFFLGMITKQKRPEGLFFDC
uniref:hypothetical protein n=1 Tax=Algoriphagus sp. TaxID=1872435 RepID=UPI00404812D5